MNRWVGLHIDKLNTHIYMYIYIYICTYIYAYIYNTCLFVVHSVYVYIHMYKCTSVGMCMYVYVDTVNLEPVYVPSFAVAYMCVLICACTNCSRLNTCTISRVCKPAIISMHSSALFSSLTRYAITQYSNQ